jgi:hypothetical protein
MIIPFDRELIANNYKILLHGHYSTGMIVQCADRALNFINLFFLKKRLPALRAHQCRNGIEYNMIPLPVDMVRDRAFYQFSLT